MAKPKKTGKPKALNVEPEESDEPSLREFIEQMHGDGTLATPQNGLPSLVWIKEQFRTKSAAIRYLVNQGHEVKVIAKHLGVRYQMVRNIAHNPLKRGPNEDWRKPLLQAAGIPEAKAYSPNPESTGTPNQQSADLIEEEDEDPEIEGS